MVGGEQLDGSRAAADPQRRPFEPLELLQQTLAVGCANTASAGWQRKDCGPAEHLEPSRLISIPWIAG
jgi:hypothetical protein